MRVKCSLADIDYSVCYVYVTYVPPNHASTGCRQGDNNNIRQDKEDVFVYCPGRLVLGKGLLVCLPARLSVCLYALHSGPRACVPSKESAGDHTKYCSLEAPTSAHQQTATHGQNRTNTSFLKWQIGGSVYK